MELLQQLLPSPPATLHFLNLEPNSHMKSEYFSFNLIAIGHNLMQICQKGYSFKAVFYTFMVWNENKNFNFIKFESEKNEIVYQQVREQLTHYKSLLKKVPQGRQEK